MKGLRDSIRTNPILVTGSHRSGTTWIGKTISYSAWAHYLSEPFNPNSSFLGGLVRQWYHYVTANDVEPFTKAMGAILAYEFEPSHRKRVLQWLPSRQQLYRYTRKHLGIPRPVLKDPIAAMSSEWLARTFDMDVVCLVRHPAAFVLSIRKAGWGYDYRPFLTQTELIDNWLGNQVDLLTRPLGDVIEGGSILWLCIYQVLREYASRNPSWMTWRLEDIALNSVSALKSIYNRVGLPFTQRIVNRIRRDSNTTNPIDAPTNNPHLIQRNSLALRVQWRSALTPADLLRIRNIVEPVSCSFYGDEDW